MNKQDESKILLQNRTARILYLFVLTFSLILCITRFDKMPLDVRIIAIAMPILGLVPSFRRNTNKTVHGVIFSCLIMYVVFRMATPLDYVGDLDYYMLAVFCVSMLYLEEVVLLCESVLFLVLYFTTLVINLNTPDYVFEYKWISIIISFAMLVFSVCILFQTIRRSKTNVKYVQRRNHNFNQMTKLLKIKKEESEAVAKSKIDFLANTSHEIRTPMNAIIGMSELALREDISPEVRQYLANIQSASKSLLAIINDVLDFSKIESHKIELFESNYSIVNIANDVCNIIATRIDASSVRLLTDIDPSIPGVLYGDDLRIKQIILNLATNAAKFTQRGSITIKIGFRNITEDRIMLHISVIDTGIGIRRRDLEKLFRAFEQVHVKNANNTEGTGLGLVICKSLVELMGGTIGVNSTFGTGSEFYLDIPQRVIDRKCCISIRNAAKFNTAVLVSNMHSSGLLDRLLSQLDLSVTLYRSFDEWYADRKKYTHTIMSYDYYEAHNEEINSVASNMNISVVAEYEMSMPLWRGIGKLQSPVALADLMKLYESGGEEKKKADSFTAPDARVLIVDDNKTNLLVAKSLMKPYNMQITTADGGLMALELIGRNEYDLIFMDHMMPDLDGVETTKRIRGGDKSKNVPIIALTANASVGASGEFFAAGMNGFLAKPIEPVELNSVLEKWLPAGVVNYGGKRAAASEESKEVKPSAAVVEQLREIDELDVNFGMGQCLQDTDLYIEILDTAIHSPTFDELLVSYNNEDYKNYTIYVHGLKGSARNIGMGVIGNLAFELELAGKRGDIEYIHANHKAFVEEYTALSKRIGDIIKPLAEKPAGKAKRTVTVADEKWALDDMKSACGDFDYAWAEKLFEEFAEKSFGADGDAQLEQIKADIEAFEFDAAAEKIDLLLKWGEANG